MSANGTRWKSMIVETARLSGLPRLLTRTFGGIGAIIAMHRVRVPSDEPFQPNRTLEVTPDFLDRMLVHFRELDIDVVSLDEMHRRLTTGETGKRFVCLTLDDGYADNYLDALPVFKAHDAPFSVYLTTGFVDHTAYFWWMLLEDVIRGNERVTLRIGEEEQSLPTTTLEEKERAFEVLHGRFRALAADDVIPVARRLCEDYDIDPPAFCAEHAMSWAMAREITEGGLGTIEAHMETHLALSRLTPEDIEGEMARSMARIAEKTGRTPHHFAYPFGDADAVTKRDIDLLASQPINTATTTRAGILKPQYAEALTALPRITMNGLYQSEGYVDLALSGLQAMISRA